MADEIRPEDVRRIAAQKEREVFGERGARRYVDARMDFSLQQPLALSDALPPLAADPRVRGPYDRPRLGVEPALELNVEAEDDDLGLPPSYSSTDYSRDEEYFEEERPRRRRLLPMSVAFLALVGFAGVVWYAYDWSSTGGAGRGQAPVIQASAVEEKVKPANEAGMQVPNQESTVLNSEPERPVEEVLMPPPEEPAPVLVLSPTLPDPEDEPVVVLTPAAPPAPPSPAPVASQQSSNTDTIAALIAAETASQAQTAAAAASAAPATPPAPAVTPPAVTPAASPAVTLPAPTPAGAPAMPAGAFLIQLASLTSVEAAEKTWAGLQRKHVALLGDMAVNIQKAEIDGKGTYFRVQAGPLPNRATADDMCAQLKAAQQDCIVVKR